MTNICKKLINGEEVFAVVLGDTLCLLPEIDDMGCHIEDVCDLVKILGSDEIVAVCNETIVDRTCVDIDHAYWYRNSTRTKRGRRSSSNNKMRKRIERDKFLEEDLPF